MGPDDHEHPDVLTDADEIDLVGGIPWVMAIGEVVAMTDSLLDGPKAPYFENASRKAQDVLYEYPPYNGVRMFARQFWGSNGKSVIAAFCEKAGRPALMSIVPVGLDAKGVGKLDTQQATQAALRLAEQRSADL